MKVDIETNLKKLEKPNKLSKRENTLLRVVVGLIVLLLLLLASRWYITRGQ